MSCGFPHVPTRFHCSELRLGTSPWVQDPPMVLLPCRMCVLLREGSQQWVLPCVRLEHAAFSRLEKCGVTHASGMLDRPDIIIYSSLVQGLVRIRAASRHGDQAASQASEEEQKVYQTHATAPSSGSNEGLPRGVPRLEVWTP